MATPLGMAPLPIVAAVRPAQISPMPTPRLTDPRPADTHFSGSRTLSPRLSAKLTPGQQCRVAIRAAERAAQIPDQLMAAIARIESGRKEADGTVNPWPWSINVAGIDHIFDTKAEAVAAVRALQGQGVRSIDVGCMQVNLMYHPDAFASVEDGFDPAANAGYAARFLVQLHDQSGTWPTATAWYHSATPDLGEDYRRKVMAVWPEENRQQPPDTARTDLAAAWGATRQGGGGILTASGTGIPTSEASFGGGASTGNRAASAHMLPLPSGAGPGRGLTAYRAVPIPLATRPLLPLTTALTSRD